MAPPKAPAGSGPEAATAKGKSSKSPPLTLRELHQVVLRMVSLAALAEGSTVQPGSRTERQLLDYFRKIDRLVDHAERRVRLADVLDSKGNIIGGVKLADFDLVELQRSLRSICRGQKRLLNTERFKARTFSKAIEIAFGVAGVPISTASADEDVELVTTIYRSSSPSSMTDVILGRHQLSKTRKIQYLLPALAEAKRTRGHLAKNDINMDLKVVQEFLTCLQIHRSEVLVQTTRLLALRERRRKGHGDYSLRDVAPAFPSSEFPSPSPPKAKNASAKTREPKA